MGSAGGSEREGDCKRTRENLLSRKSSASWIEPSQPGSYLPPFVCHAHLRKAGAYLLMGMDCIQPTCRTAAARQGGSSPARPKKLLILAVCCRDACCIAKASRGIRGAQHRRIDIWAGDRWIEGPGLSYPLIHPQHFSRNGFCSVLLQKPACS